MNIPFLMRTIKLLIFLILTVLKTSAQDSLSRADRIISFPDKLFGTLDKKSRIIEEKLDRQTDKYLSKLQRQENKLRKKLYKKDSVLAKQLFEGVDSKYAQLKTSSGKLASYQS